VKQFSAPAGLEIGIARRRPAVDPGIRIDEYATRLLGAMAPVSATPVAPGSRRIQYWMLNGMLRRADADRADPRLSYDFTYIADRPVGWERAKTFGHSHARPEPDRLGFAEVIEILDGKVGFIVQDLLPGPRCTFAALVTTQPRDRIILPPLLSHATINLGGDPVVFSDIIDRRIVDGRLPSEYGQVRAARGMAYYIDLGGNVRPNPTYMEVPTLQRFTATEWSGPSPDRPLYRDYIENPGLFDWIIDPELFPERFLMLWDRVRGVIAALDDRDSRPERSTPALA
jgi:oxalate decarboxylase/phosphoglucose isomerase-like protein (cupin superfamily)